MSTQRPSAAAARQKGHLTVDDGTVSVRQAADGLLRHRWRLLVALTLIGGLLGGALALLQTPTYSATAEFVVGNEDLPTALATSVDPKRTGPLGVDLPAETLARMVVSTPVSQRVAAAFSLSPEASSTIANSAKAKAVTTNAFTVTVEGATAEEAARNANAYAAQFLAYRRDTAKQLLGDLAKEATATADAATKDALAMQATINADVQRNASSDAAAVRTAQAQLLSQARDAKATAAFLTATAASYDGGGTVTVPAEASDATKSPSILRTAGFGALAGLLIALVIGLLLEKSASRVRTRQDAALAAEAPVLLSLPTKRGVIDGAALARESELALLRLARDPQAAELEPGIVLRPLHRTAAADQVARALSEALDRVDGAAGYATSLPRGRSTSLPPADRVTVTAPHDHDGGPLAWPQAGIPVVLLVEVGEHKADLMRAAHELRVAGVPLVGVALLGVEPRDETLGDTVAPSVPAPAFPMPTAAPATVAAPATPSAPDAATAVPAAPVPAAVPAPSPTQANGKDSAARSRDDAAEDLADMLREPGSRGGRRP